MKLEQTKYRHIQSVLSCKIWKIKKHIGVLVERKFYDLKSSVLRQMSTGPWKIPNCFLQVTKKLLNIMIVTADRALPVMCG